MTRWGAKRLTVAALAVLLGLVVVGAEAEVDEYGTVQVDIRVWQGVMDPREVLLSARPSAGKWVAPPEELPLEEMNKRGTYRYSDRTVAVAVGDGTAYVDVRVWQSVRDPRRVYLSARPARGRWGATERLPMARDEHDGYRYSDRTVATPTPAPLDDDFAALLAWKDTQAGASALNWSRGRAMLSWTGVTVAGTPQRVTKLELANGGLTGELSGLVGELTGLTELRLDGNALTGRIPSKVAQLKSLTHVYLAGNAFTGCVPPSLRAVVNSDLVRLGLPDCGAPVALDSSYDELTLTAGAYQFIWPGPSGDGDSPLIFDVPEGLEVRDVLKSSDSLVGPPVSGLVLEDAATGRSGIAIDVRQGIVVSRWAAPTPGPGLATMLDRLAESVWIDRGCAIATLNPCGEDGEGVLEDTAENDLATLVSTTLSYDTYDTTDAVTTAGSYAFLTEGEDGSMTAVTTYEGLRDGTATALVINTSDAGGASRADILDAVAMGDIFEWRKADDCFVRYSVTKVKPDPSGTVPRKALDVAWMTYAFTGCSGAIATSDDVQIIWGALPNLGGESLRVPIIHGIYQILPVDWDGEVLPEGRVWAPRHSEERYTEDITVARTLDFWREPDLPENWVLGWAGSDQSGFGPRYGYCAAFLTEPILYNGQRLRFSAFEICGGWEPAPFQRKTSSGGDGRVVVETRVIAGRPARITYNPVEELGAMHLLIFDPETHAQYKIVTGAPFKATEPERAVGLARSLFESPTPE